MPVLDGKSSFNVKLNFLSLKVLLGVELVWDHEVSCLFQQLFKEGKTDATLGFKDTMASRI